MPDTFPYATTAQITVARDYVRACIEYVTADPEPIAAVEAMDSDAVIRKALRMWPDGDWPHFCEYFASDIDNAEQQAAGNDACPNPSN